MSIKLYNKKYKNLNYATPEEQMKIIKQDG